MNHNDAVDVMQFGFLNVFLAAIQAANEETTADDLGPLLTRADLAGIEFLPDGISIDQTNNKTEPLQNCLRNPVSRPSFPAKRLDQMAFCQST